jgi:hypothetical protein
MDSFKKDKILWEEQCYVCQKNICFYGDLRWAPSQVRPEDGVTVCALDINACFNYYHDKCFDAHECSVHPKKDVGI